MPIVSTDDRGRITIPKAVRDRLGERYWLVERPNAVRLIPIPDDPVAALRQSASESFKEASIEELRAAAREWPRD